MSQTSGGREPKGYPMDCCGAHKKFSEHCAECRYVRALEATLARPADAPGGGKSEREWDLEGDLASLCDLLNSALRDTHAGPEVTPENMKPGIESLWFTLNRLRAPSPAPAPTDQAGVRALVEDAITHMFTLDPEAAEELQNRHAALTQPPRPPEDARERKVFCDGCGDELETVNANGATRVLICQACVYRPEHHVQCPPAPPAAPAVGDAG